jgi:2-methylfumaryl-CoA isomerase
MTADPAPMTAVQYAVRTAGDQLIVLAEAHHDSLAEAQHDSAFGVRIGPGGPGGFARDFATADGQRVMVAAFTRQQFADLAQMTRLAGTFAFLERVLHADFSDANDLYAHRGAIATLLAPWFSRRTVADLAAAFTGTSVPWARLHGLNSRPSRCGAVRSLKR